MNNLQVIEYRGKRVLTSQQLAEVYGTDSKTISYNFNYNRSRYIEGKHFICLTGDELKRYKTNLEIHESSRINKLYLWTEKGAFMHAKSLNTDTAWEVYDRLVDSYFQKKNDDGTPVTYRDAIAQLLESLDREEELKRQLDVSKDWYSIKRVAALNGVNWKTFKWRKLKAAGERLGYEVKKVFDANYGEVNTYHKNVWAAVYPDYEL
ncbi:ORF6N domain-containing protein [Clostridium sp. AF22-10]|uniref:ORF6N domain-containing protein n=1 Tax=Clostridium sp. AF22-10 TaxID=2293004 RepID=UPI000E51F590|nr:ORF6N domain-containing protein [Clostridium sp. AF22-10]